jgi:hypothetical protein
VKQSIRQRSARASTDDIRLAVKGVNPASGKRRRKDGPSPSEPAATTAPATSPARAQRPLPQGAPAMTRTPPARYPLSEGRGPASVSTYTGRNRKDIWCFLSGEGCKIAMRQATAQGRANALARTQHQCWLCSAARHSVCAYAAGSDVPDELRRLVPEEVFLCGRRCVESYAELTGELSRSPCVGEAVRSLMTVSETEKDASAMEDVTTGENLKGHSAPRKLDCDSCGLADATVIDRTPDRAWSTKKGAILRNRGAPELQHFNRLLLQTWRESEMCAVSLKGMGAARESLSSALIRRV